MGNFVYTPPVSRGWLSKHFDKFIWPIAGTILGGVLTPLTLSWLQNKSSDIVVRQFYNTVEQKAVPKQVGGLLGARTLQRMVELGWLTMEQAQGILNQARGR